MFILLVVIGCVSSVFNGWHTSLYRLGLNDCNNFKSHIADASKGFCNTFSHLDGFCSQETSLLHNAKFLGDADWSPTFNFITDDNDWSTIANNNGFGISRAMTSQCDVLRLSALVGTEWTSGQDESRNFELIFSFTDSSTNMYKVMDGEHVRNVPGQLTTNVAISWQTSVIAYILIPDNSLKMSVEVIASQDSTDLFLSNEVGFFTTNEERVSHQHFLKKSTFSEPLFFTTDKRSGFVNSVTGRCIDEYLGSNMVQREVLGHPAYWVDSQVKYVATCTGGYRIPGTVGISRRKISSEKSAICVCFSEGVAEVWSGQLVSYTFCSQKCTALSKALPTWEQVDQGMCDRDSLDSIFPFGYFQYFWIEEGIHALVESVETTDDIIYSETVEFNQNDIVVGVKAETVRPGTGGLETISSEFPQLINTPQWGIVATFSFPWQCRVLETTTEYKPAVADAEVIKIVSRWIVDRRNGYWGVGLYSNVNKAIGRTRDMRTANSWDILLHFQDDNTGVWEWLEYYDFYEFSEINFLRGSTNDDGSYKTTVNEDKVPFISNMIGDARNPDSEIWIRTFISVSTVSSCSFGSAMNSYYANAYLLNHETNEHLSIFPTDHQWGPSVWDEGDYYKFDMGEYESQIAQTSTNPKFTLNPGQYYLMDLHFFLEHWSLRKSPFRQSSLLWDCGSGIEVVPRMNVFSVGNLVNHIISDKVHIDLLRKSSFRITLTSPPEQNSKVVCEGPSTVVITPHEVTFTPGAGPEMWSAFRTMHVYSTATYFNSANNPDSSIRCFSPNHNSAGFAGHPVSISFTLVPENPQQFILSPSGYFANYFKHESVWKVRDRSMSPKGCTTNLFKYWDQDFSFIIQSKHDGIEALGYEVAPVVGVAFNYGPYVLAAYTSISSTTGWDIYNLAPAVNGGPIVKTDVPRTTTIEFPCGSQCEIIRDGDNFMHVWCVISGAFTDGVEGYFSTNAASTLCVEPGDSFFEYPTGGQNLMQTNVWPQWPWGSGHNIVQHPIPIVARPNVLTALHLNFPQDEEKFTPQELSDWASWRHDMSNPYDFSLGGVWNSVKSHNRCPLMSSDLHNALRPFINSRVRTYVPQIEFPEYVQSLFKQCTSDYFMQKFLSCLGPYYFNENDARQAFRSSVYHITTMARQVSDTVGLMGRQLVSLVDGDKVHHLCSRDGHLVGRPPQCVCSTNSGSSNYPECADEPDCPPANAWQLNILSQLANPQAGTEFCSVEKSIVIVDELGVSMNCFRGFCYYWSSLKVRTGLKYEMCVTPYCLKGYYTSTGTIFWYGLTECGELVESGDNGETWTKSDLPWEEVARQLTDAQLATNVPADPEMEEVPIAGGLNERYQVSQSAILRIGQSSGKEYHVKVTWWCECIDPATWNAIL